MSNCLFVIKLSVKKKSIYLSGSSYQRFTESAGSMAYAFQITLQANHVPQHLRLPELVGVVNLVLRAFSYFRKTYMSNTN